MKKIISLLLAAVMILGLAACGATEAPAPAETQAPAANNAETAAPEAEAPAEDVTIQVAAVSTAFTDNYPEMWTDVAAAFTEATGIKVELIEDKNLEDVIGPSMQGGEYPDVVYLPYGRPGALTEQFVKEHLMAELTDVLSMKVPGEDKMVSEKMAGGFVDTSLTNPYADGKTYLAPTFC